MHSRQRRGSKKYSALAAAYASGITGATTPVMAMLTMATRGDHQSEGCTSS